MRLATSGILVNQFNQLLLIQRNDTRTFAEPGGGLEKGELPTDNIAREVREETGIIALPVRLVSLNYWALPPHGFLAFTFRCLQRGGELQTSAESPRVGFYATHPLPRPMLPVNRQRIDHALKHDGGPVQWWTVPYPLFMRLGRFFLFNGIYRWYDWRRKAQGLPLYQTPPNWEIDTRVVLQNESGAVLWHQANGAYCLPGGIVPPQTAPWDTAVTLTHQQTGLTPQLQDVSGIYVIENSSRMLMVFTAVPHPSAPTMSGNTWLPPGQIPSELPSQCHQIIQHATKPDRQTICQHLPDDCP
ncbi:MAG TPA: NUDIX domain-containing protein [Chloroflexota bacterium]|nr:NUDIX domain-containing protein [Chloroflexota bacterium]HUM70320.1 NUDIX domain-containing protein [Chloroflexota bacterium]